MSTVTMDYGFGIPMRGALAQPENIERMAKRGEALGFANLAIPDHIVVPRSIASRYPYSPDGAFARGAADNCFEQLTVMAYLAAITTKIRLVTSVMVVPHRHPVHTAKVLSTIDLLSGGRVTVGVGAGWMEEEFLAIGAPAFAERGRVTDEYLDAFKELWINDNPEFRGDYASFADITFLPKPVQSPHPPLWVGGESRAALRRVVRCGDAWYPIGANPRFPLNTMDRYRAAVGELRQIAEEGGRDPAEIALTYWAHWPYELQQSIADDGGRHLFTGEPQAIADDINAFRELGVRHLLFNFQRDTLEASLASMERFSEQVLAGVRS